MTTRYYGCSAANAHLTLIPAGQPHTYGEEYDPEDGTGAVYDEHALIVRGDEATVFTGSQPELLALFARCTDAVQELPPVSPGRIVSGTVVSSRPTPAALPAPAASRPGDEEEAEVCASWAQVAIDAYTAAVGPNNYTPGTDPDTGAQCVSDLLADLQHYCEREGIDFEAALVRSQTHVREESPTAA